MAKRPTSRSQADDTGAAAPDARPRRPRASKQNVPEPPGAPVPPEPVRAEAVTSESSSATWSPTEEDIRVRAYHRYLERGGSHGLEFDDWVEAEKELKKTR